MFTRQIAIKGKKLLGFSIANFARKTTMSDDEEMPRSNYIKKQKEKYASMDIDEKRKLYKAKEYFTLENIETWADLARRDNLKSEPDQPLYEKNDAFNAKVSLWSGNITQLEIDAIVNAANNSLMGGGGVDGAIHRASGSDLVKECSLLNGCETGDAKLTCGYNLPAKYVIHTVGPIGEKPRLLASCYKRALTICKENAIRSVAFPCISTGIYGYPNEGATVIVLKTVREWLQADQNADAVDRIIFCLFLDVDKTLYREYMPKYFPVLEP